MSTQSNIFEFINKSNIIHKNKYDYSESIYINAKTSIKIKCKLHGIFIQLPMNHLKGCGCKICGHIKGNAITAKKNKGIKRSEEYKKNFSIKAKLLGFGKWMKGRSPSIEIREKIGKAHLGHLTSKETRLKISIKNKGINNGMFGEKHTEKSLIKISDASKNMWKNIEIRNKLMNDPNRKKYSRKGAITAHSKNPNFRFHNTKPEREMKEILINLGLEFKHNYPIWNIEHQYCVDFYIPKYNLIIETDGTYWHNYPNYTEKDKIREKELFEKNYKILRFWENMFDYTIVKNKISELINDHYQPNLPLEFTN